MSHSFSQNFANFTSKYQTKQELIEQLYLKVLIASYTRVKQIEEVKALSENTIRNRFIDDLLHNNVLFMKHHKTIHLASENQIITEHDLFRTDIEFFVSQYGTFVIECKKLKGAEKRYITDADGKGGVERFTNSDYAADEEEAGMIGFIVQGKPERIMQDLKKKIQAFSPAENIAALLTQKCAEWDLSFQSKHIREAHPPIHLYHLFFDFV